MKLPTIFKEYVTIYILTITKPHSLIYLIDRGLLEYTIFLQF